MWAKTPILPTLETDALDSLLMGFLGERWPIRKGSKAAEASRVEEVGILITTPPPFTWPLAPRITFPLDLH